MCIQQSSPSSVGRAKGFPEAAFDGITDRKTFIPGECEGTSGLLLLCTGLVMYQDIAVVVFRCSFFHSEWLDILFRQKNIFIKVVVRGGGGKLGFNVLNFKFLVYKA